MHKISSNQVLTFSFLLSCFFFTGFGNTIILKEARNSSILACIVGTIIGIIPLLLILSITKKNPDKNIFELNIERFKIFGHILNFLLILSVIYFFTVSVWEIINFIISQFLTRTSYYLVAAFICIIVSLVVIKGLEVLSRTSFILTIIFTVTVLFAWIFLIPNVEVNNFYPIMEASTNSFFKTALYFSSFSVLPLMTLLFIKRDDLIDKEKFNKKVIIGYIITAILTIEFLTLIIGTYGIDLSLLYAYPEYSLFKKINAFYFIQRIENIIAITIFITAFISFSLFTSFIINYFKSTFKIKEKRTIDITTVLITFSISFVSIYLFTNNKILPLYTRYPNYSKYIFILLLINWFLLKLTKKKSTENS